MIIKIPKGRRINPKHDPFGIYKAFESLFDLFNFMTKWYIFHIIIGIMIILCIPLLIIFTFDIFVDGADMYNIPCHTEIHSKNKEYCNFVMWAENMDNCNYHSNYTDNKYRGNVTICSGVDRFKYYFNESILPPWDSSICKIKGFNCTQIVTLGNNSFITYYDIDESDNYSLVLNESAEYGVSFINTTPIRVEEPSRTQEIIQKKIIPKINNYMIQIGVISNDTNNSK